MAHAFGRHDLGRLGMAAERGPGGFSWGRPVPLIGSFNICHLI